MLNYQTSALVAAGDTVKTLIEEMTIAKGKKLVGIWCDADRVAGLTTIVPCSGIFEAESATIDGLLPCVLPLQTHQGLTSGASSHDAKVWPLDIPIKFGDKIKVSVTMDVAQTGANACRFGIVTES
jgi:ammonia channel protein AmtB